MVRELAEYEQLAHQAVATEADFETRACSGRNAKAYALIVEHEGQTAGFRDLFLQLFDLPGTPGIYVEDVFIRRNSAATALAGLIFKYLAQKAVAENCGRMEWWVLDWNEPAIRFYAGLGAADGRMDRAAPDRRRAEDSFAER